MKNKIENVELRVKHRIWVELWGGTRNDVNKSVRKIIMKNIWDKVGMDLQYIIQEDLYEKRD